MSAANVTIEVPTRLLQYTCDGCGTIRLAPLPDDWGATGTVHQHQTNTAHHYCPGCWAARTPRVLA